MLHILIYESMYRSFRQPCAVPAKKLELCSTRTSTVIKVTTDSQPGTLLDDMNRIMIREIAKSFDDLQPPRGEKRKVGMYMWVRDSITRTTTKSVYGPMSPYEDKAIADAFCQPSLTARKLIAAQSRVSDAFQEYYKAGGVDKASALTRMRYQVEVDHNVPLEDIARYEVGGSIAVLFNTAPNRLLHRIVAIDEDRYYDQDLGCDNSGRKVPFTSVSVSGRSPTSMGTSVREVMEDTLLEGFLLKKGTMLQMPSRIIHQDTDLWSADVTQFNPRRFLPEEKKNRPSEACFRAFGGGKTLCPGRHFATNEILAVVAVFIARFDMKPLEGDWRHPSTINTNVAAVVMEPDDDIEVEVETRKGFEDVDWEIKLHKSEKIFAMVTEDNEG
ncbi:unnamed protein product [Periconia digitata]|uniref:Cytochrome P450 n=1 Tax=Periconia digitata TaxID=1303443 RepID=A0A9W4U5Q0_9PLEO|nr:unnamed protein product [Periconia digitata]